METRAEFEALCQRLTQGENYFFGNAALAEARAKIDSTPLDSETRVAALIELGYELVRLGEHQEAINEQIANAKGISKREFLSMPNCIPCYR